MCEFPDAHGVADVNALAWAPLAGSRASLPQTPSSIPPEAFNLPTEDEDDSDADSIDPASDDMEMHDGPDDYEVDDDQAHAPPSPPKARTWADAPDTPEHSLTLASCGDDGQINLWTVTLD